MNSLSPDQVRAQIERFWKVMSGKSKDRLEDFYAPGAIVFTGKARQPEPAAAALGRRARQLASASAATSAEVGEMDIRIAAAEYAIATYTYRFHDTRAGQGGVSQRHTLFGRATQIFHQEKDGRLLLVHEHLSAAVPPEVEKSGSK